MHKRSWSVPLQTVAGASRPASILQPPLFFAVSLTHLGKPINQRTSHECFAQNVFSSLLEPLKALCSNGRSIEPK